MKFRFLKRQSLSGNRNCLLENSQDMKRLVICIFNHSDRVKNPVVTQSCLRNHAKCLQNRYRPQGALTWHPYLAAYIIGQVTNLFAAGKFTDFVSKSLHEERFRYCPRPLLEYIIESALLS